MEPYALVKPHYQLEMEMNNTPIVNIFRAQTVSISIQEKHGTPTSSFLLPDDIIIEILLWLPIKSLSKFMSVSKSWLQLISSPTFVKNHIKLTANHKGSSHHRLLFQNTNGNFKFCSLPPLFTKQKLIHIDSPLESSTSSVYIVGSVNGLICVFNGLKDAYIWNPTITKSKELLNLASNICSDSSVKCGFGFGYDESRDDYKVVFIDHCIRYNPFSPFYSSSNMRIVVKLYSLRTNSWTTLHDQLQGNIPLSLYGKFVNGKLYWTSSSGFDEYRVCNITSFDLADETWGSLELPSRGEDHSDINLGVVGHDLSLLYTCHRGVAISDVCILEFMYLG